MEKKIKIGFILLSLLTLMASSYQMYSLNEQRLLWGRLPLVFFSSLLSLGFPPAPLTFLLFVAFVPLLWIEDHFSQQGKGSTRRLFKYTYVSFVLWNILTTFWVANTAFSAAFLAIGLNAFFMCVPFLLFHKTTKHNKR